MIIDYLFMGSRSNKKLPFSVGCFEIYEMAHAVEGWLLHFNRPAGV